jgi:hypothetical protein
MAQVTQRESKLSRRIMDALKEEYRERVFVFKVWGNEMQVAGLPDILGCLDGMYFGLESKLPESRDKVSPKQEFIHTQITNAGGRVAVVCSPGEALRTVEMWREAYAGQDHRRR